jgi:hypothetical protein
MCIGYLCNSVVEPELEPQEPQLFALAEPGPVPDPGTGLGPGSNILGNNAASSIEKANFLKNFVVVEKLC